MHPPRIAIISFPGNNCEVESLRSVREAGMEAIFFRWNDDREKLKEVDGYFIPGGFSYEDRGRSGMVAGRDPVMEFIGQEAEAGKVVIGNCNGAQILVESGLIPLGKELDMSLARNVVDGVPVGFLSEWVWITPSCASDRCATSDWGGQRVMQLPIAHGEGRFTTRDNDLLAELKANDQIAFQYCGREGNVSEDPEITPNGAMFAIAGICNPAGNVVALMPHPERTSLGAQYFSSIRKWIEKGKKSRESKETKRSRIEVVVRDTHPADVELFIDTVITNNEERTVEAAARRVVPELRLKQLRYIPWKMEPNAYLSHISNFNPNKESAYIRRNSEIFKWNATQKREERMQSHNLLDGIALLRRDEPFESELDVGICYVIAGVSDQQLQQSNLLEVFANPHASTLTRLR